ncbi:MAG TPA: acyltransferase [Pirellulales bacterium]|nr:acyltransferase [Pirellulales bacterium]
MSWSTKLRRGEGRLWGPLKRTAKLLLGLHLPVVGPLRLVVRGAYLLHVVARDGTALALRFFWYEPLFRGQCEHVGAPFYMERLPYLVGRGRILLGDGVRLSGKSSFGFSNRLHDKPELVIGDGTFIGHDCDIGVASSIRIGRSCLIASRTCISDHDGHPLDATRRRAGLPTPREQVQPVVIGDDVWIGAGALILKGVTIGDRSVVAARAVVTKDVPADVIVAGNPARVVRRLADDERPDNPPPIESTSTEPAAQPANNLYA